MVGLVRDMGEIQDALVADGLGLEAVSKGMLIIAALAVAEARNQPLDDADQIRAALIEIVSLDLCEVISGLIRSRHHGGGTA